MNRDHFWLNDRQFTRLVPHLPTDTRGKPRVDDRRVISGIVHVLKSGCRWTDAPLLYGPRKTLYIVRWAAKGVWLDIFHALAAARRPTGRGADRLLCRESAPLRLGRKRMARPVGKQFRRANLSSLHQRMRSQGRTLAKMEIRASRAS
jgi:transposase